MGPFVKPLANHLPRRSIRSRLAPIPQQGHYPIYLARSFDDENDDNILVLDPKWTEHKLPYASYIPYFYHKGYRLVTTANIRKPQIQDNIIKRMRDFIKGIDLSSDYHEIVVLPEPSGFLYLLNHNECIVERSNDPVSGSRSLLYWKTLFRYPCHRPIPESVEQRAIKTLHEAWALNLCLGRESDPSFSTAEILGFFEFFKSHSELRASSTDIIAKAMVVSHVLHRAEFHADKSIPLPGPSLSLGRSSVSTPVAVGLKMLFLVSSCGMPPDYDLRFNAARSEYEQTFQLSIWTSFISQIVKERSDKSIVAGLLFSASTSFLALPDHFYVAQFLTIVCTGLALSCVVIGLDPGVSQALEEIKRIDLDVSDSENARMEAMAHSMNQQATILLLSMFCFFLALLSYTGWTVYFSASTAKKYPVPLLFYVLAFVGLLVISVVIFFWNRRMNRRQE